MLDIQARPASAQKREPIGLAERVLLALSHEPAASDRGAEPSPDKAVAHIEAALPGIVHALGGARVLDFGCGTGALAVGLAQLGCTVHGLDIQRRLLESARTLAGDTPGVTFSDVIPPGGFDWVVSINSMEHFADPLEILHQMAGLLRPHGRIFVTFCPTWLAPYGAHMHHFTRVPWVHLLFPERAVMAVRARYVDDGATRYEDVTGGLNRMTVGRFFDLVADAGLACEYARVDTVKGLPVHRIPLLRELLANRVTAILGH